MKRLSITYASVFSPLILGLGLLALTTFGETGCGALGLTYSLTGMYVEPQVNLTCVAPGMTAQYKAYGSFTEGGHATKIKDISSQVNWSVSLPELATVNSSGLVTAATNYIGTTPIIATTHGEFGELKSDSNLQISTTCVTTSARIVPFQFNIVPASHNLNVSATLQPLAVASAADSGRTLDLSRQASWTSSDPSVALVDSSGIIHAIGPGDATVTAVSKTPGGETVSATEAIHVSGNADAP